MPSFAGISEGKEDGGAPPPPARFMYVPNLLP